MRTASIASAIALLVSAPGCPRSTYGEFGGRRVGHTGDVIVASPAGRTHSVEVHQPRAPWRVLGTASVGGDADYAWDLAPNGVFYAHVVSRRRGDPDTGFVVAADTKGRGELWCVELPADVIPTQVLYPPDGPVLVYHPALAVAALDPATGEQLWRKPTPEPVPAGWHAIRGVQGAGVLALAPDGVLMLTPSELALMDPADWSKHWSVPLGSVGGYHCRYAPPTAVGGTIVSLVYRRETFGRRLVAIDAKRRRVLWEQDLGHLWDVTEAATDSLGALAVGAGAVACLKDAVEYGGLTLPEREDLGKPRPRLACFELSTGQKRWEVTLAGWPSFTNNKDGVIVACGEYLLVAARHRSNARLDKCLIYSLRDGSLARTIRDVEPRPVAVDGTVAWLEGKTVAIARPPSFDVTQRIELGAATSTTWYAYMKAVRNSVVVVGRDRARDGTSVTRVSVFGPDR